MLGLDLAHGGHLTHGLKINISGRLFHFIAYGVHPKTHRIDFDQLAALAKEHKPKMIVAGASAYPREIPHAKFAEIARDCGAKLMVDMAHYAGLVAAGLHDDPVPVAEFVTTTTHKTLRGPRAGLILCREEFARDVDRAIFPGTQGGPLMHVIAGKAACLGEALRPEFKGYAQQIIDNAKTLAEVLAAGGIALVSGGTDNHLLLADVTPLGTTGRQAEASARPLRHHRQQEHDSVRPAQADGPLGHPDRHAGPDHAGHGQGRDATGSAGGSSRCSRPRTTRRCSRTDPRGGRRRCASQFPVPAAVLAKIIRPREGAAAMAKDRILIADDNPTNVELLEAYLSDLDCEIAIAVDGRDTLEKVAEFQPDLILLDIMMPKLSGFEVCKKLKDDPATKGIMILMVTALNELGDIERAVNAGCDDFLSKPVNKLELLKRVDNMLKLRHVTDELERLRSYIDGMDD